MQVLRINLKILQKVVFILTVIGIRSLSMYVLKCLKFILRINLKILQKVVFILTVVGIRSLSMYVLKCLKFILDSIFLAKNEN